MKFLLGLPHLGLVGPRRLRCFHLIRGLRNERCWLWTSSDVRLWHGSSRQRSKEVCSSQHCYDRIWFYDHWANFLERHCIPDIVSELYTPPYGNTDVFICSNGFGGYGNIDYYDYRHIGWIKRRTNGSLLDRSITDWNVRGYWEEGYFAMSKSMENVPQAIDNVNLNTEYSELHKNMMLVSDEVRLPSNTTNSHNCLDSTGTPLFHRIVIPQIGPQLQQWWDTDHRPCLHLEYCCWFHH